jgi:hypothetical protein
VLASDWHLTEPMGFESNVDHPKPLRYLFRSCCDLDLELRPGTAIYKSGPRHHPRV